MNEALLLNGAIALLPVLAMIALFVWLDMFKLMSLSEILLLLVMGGLAAAAAYPIAGRLIDVLPIGYSNYSRFVAPWIEEALKSLAVIWLLARNRIGYKIDAVISGFAIGAGFSLVENLLYLSRFPDYGPQTWMVRGLGTALMHGATVAIIAATAHEFAERENREAAGEFDYAIWWTLPGLIVAALIHTAFNQFADQPMIAMLGALVGTPLVVMAIFAFGSSEARDWLVKESADHRAALAALDAGAWPDNASGRKIAALAARSGEPQAQLIRDYLTVTMRLTVAAEEKLLGKGIPDHAAIAGDFERQGALRKAMGCAGWAALAPLLPFSRNDEWEVRELAEDLRGLA